MSDCVDAVKETNGHKDSVFSETATSETQLNLHMTMSEGYSDTLGIKSGRHNMSTDSTMDMEMQAHSAGSNYQKDIMTGKTIHVEDSQVHTNHAVGRPYEQDVEVQTNYEKDITGETIHVEDSRVHTNNGVGRPYEQDNVSDVGSDFTIVNDLEDAQHPYTQEEGPMCNMEMSLFTAGHDSDRHRERAHSFASSTLSDIEVIEGTT